MNLYSLFKFPVVSLLPLHSVCIFPLEKLVHVKRPTFIVSTAIKFFRFYVPLKILNTTSQASRDFFFFVNIRGVILAVKLVGRNTHSCFRTYHGLSDQLVPDTMMANVTVTGAILVQQLTGEKCFHTISIVRYLVLGSIRCLLLQVINQFINP